MRGDIDPAYLERLGLIVVLWSQIEAREAKFLAFLTGADPAKLNVITADTNGASLTKWLRLLCEMRWNANEVGLVDFFLHLDDTRTQRNRLVHGLWATDTKAAVVTVQTMKFDRREILQSEVITLSDLDELCTESKHILDELVEAARVNGFD